MSLVKKNILKSTGYKCYCNVTEMKQKYSRSCNWSKLGKADTKYLIISIWTAPNMLKCFCIIPSAFHVKENIRQGKADWFHLLFWKDIYTHLIRRRTKCKLYKVEERECSSRGMIVKSALKTRGRHRHSCHYKTGEYKKISSLFTHHLMMPYFTHWET